MPPYSTPAGWRREVGSRWPSRRSPPQPLTLRAVPSLPALRRQFVSQVILVDPSDVAHGLLADAAGGHVFDVVEPAVRIETVRRCFLAESRDPRRPGVVGGEREESLLLAL